MMGDPGRLAQLGEHQLDKLGVTGSSPVPPIYGSEKPCICGVFVVKAGGHCETRFGVRVGVFLGDNGCQRVSVSAGGWQSVVSIGRWKNQSWPPSYDQCQMSSDL